MPVFGSSLHDDSIIDISHESLIRKWGRLKTWVDEESDSRAMYLRLADAASRHRDHKAGLWRNPDLNFISIAALDQSLDALPPTRGLTRARAAEPT
jgi:hypothetical protein